jgi:hypothetical protein
MEAIEEVKKLEDLDLETYDDTEADQEFYCLHVLEGGKRLVPVVMPDMAEIRNLLVEDLERSMKEDRVPLLQRALFVTKLAKTDEEELLAFGQEAVARLFGFEVKE